MERWELEADLDSFTTTGEWVDKITPEWAKEEARKKGCAPVDARVIFAGYRVLVRMLHDEVTRADDRAAVDPWWANY